MRFWQSATWVETEQLCEIARLAEELGYEGVIGADHALYPESMRADYPYTESGIPPQTAESEYPDMWTSAAAILAVTERIRFVCSIYVLPLRNPIEVAKQAATLANLSRGRFVLGSGVGWMREEFDIYGVDFASRGRRMDEMVEVMKKLWSGEMVEHHGEFFDFDRIVVSPTPEHEIPLYFGGTAPVALRRVARIGDGWLGAGSTPEELPAKIAELKRLREQAGRADRPFEIVEGVYGDPDVDAYRRLEDAGLSAGINLPFFFRLGVRSSLDEKRRMMEEFAEKVIRHFED
jgi:probable F420-dependent oxidoreductase